MTWLLYWLGISLTVTVLYVSIVFLSYYTKKRAEQNLCSHLKYMYDELGRYSNKYCSKCGKKLIERVGFDDD